MLALIAITLTWTNPAWEAARTPDSSAFVLCTPSASRLHDLRWVQIRGRRTGLASDSLIAEVDSRGYEGQSQSVTFNLVGQWVIYAVAVDTAGKSACVSNALSVGGAPLTDVPILMHKPGRKWYDLAGRRIDPPRTRGIYFYQDGQEAPRRLVILK